MQSVAETLDRLARFEPVPLPVVSLYLNTQADSHGKDNYQAFLRKELSARVRTYPLRSAGRESFERDVERIQEYVSRDLKPSANGLAIFACAGKNGFFEALQLDAPIERNRLSVSQEPHLFPLARLLDQNRRFAVLLADSHSARIFVFGRGRKINEQEIENPKTARTSGGGWSQMSYQRHVENVHLHHAKEVVAVLEKVVKEESAEHVVIAGDPVIVALLSEQFSKDLAQKVIEVAKLQIRSPEQEVMQSAVEAVRERDARSDAERVESLFGQYRAGGLAVVGPEETLEALANGQVDELYLSASSSEVGQRSGAETGSEPSLPLYVSDALVARARQTDAAIRFIEDTSLLAEVGGVGATLRYRFESAPAAQTGGAS